MGVSAVPSTGPARRERAIREPQYDLGERPFMVIWEVTRACDLACRHCRAKAQPERDTNELTFEEGKALLTDVARFGRPAPLLILTGGDPFKRADLFDLIRWGDAAGLRMAASPAGTPSLTEKNISGLKEAGAKVISLSVDGATEASHDRFRGVSGVFWWTLFGWEAARKCKLPIQINTTVSRHNLGELDEIFDLVARRGALTWSVFFLVPTGRAIAEDQITPAECEDVMHFLYEASRYISAKHTEGHHFKRVVTQRLASDKKGEDPVKLYGLGETYRRLHDGLKRVVERLKLKPRPVGVVRPPLNVNAGKGLVFVSHTGEVCPSGFLPLCAGNVRESSIVSLYRDAPLLRQLRDPELLKGSCAACEFKSLCGGSRSRAYALTGDPLGPDPECAYTGGGEVPPAAEGVAEE
ncbi:MAG: TIGR04053 family radical SAM/SPASM domain-containing protein [Nitrospirae bacterium]|nr:TIGR04053 family radical SAM/SPASM domain-containing protein [Nitrospirota bacterium]